MTVVSAHHAQVEADTQAPLLFEWSKQASKYTFTYL